MNPIQPSSSPRANIVHPIAHNEANKAQAQPLPIAENPGNLALNASPRGQPRAVQRAVENEGGALNIDNNFLKALMNLPEELQCAIFKYIYTLEDCETVFQGLKEGVEIIDASDRDIGSKALEIKNLKDLLFILLEACTIEKLDFSSSPESLERLTAMAIFLGRPIKFANVSEFFVSDSLLSLISTVLEFSNKQVTIHIDNNSTELPDMSPLAGCKVMHITPSNQSEWLQLTSLNGLEKCSNLTELSLFNGKDISDISPLADLTSLTNLSLSNYFVLRDIHSLAALTKLTHLHIDNCPVLEDISSLEVLTQLTHLQLDNCPALTNISLLASLTNLTYLALKDCPILTDITFLVGLTNLTRLGLMNCPILTDINPLARLTNLTHLGLATCPLLTDIHSLTVLTKLIALWLINCSELEDISSIAGLTQLRTLYLTGATNIQNLEALQESLPNLTIIR